MSTQMLPVDHLFTLNLTTGRGTRIQGGPQGDRVIAPISGGTFSGPKLMGTVAAEAGADWVTLRADGSMKLDVRLTLLTEDGAAIYMSYNGVGAMKDGAMQVRSAPLFETGAEQYTWLNHIQAVGIGSTARGAVTYEVYALQ